MVKCAVLDKNGKEQESINLPEEVFNGQVNTDVLHQAIVMYQACQRQGTVSTKNRNDVSGGNSKPFRQKGTGRARAGSTRSPLWHGGGVTFGPHPRDFRFSVPKAIRKSALKESLNAKFLSKDLHCIADLKEPINKTKEFAKILDGLNLKGKVLAILDGSDASIARVSRNIPRFNLMRASDVNAYDVLKVKNILITKTALTQIVERVTKE